MATVVAAPHQADSQKDGTSLVNILKNRFNIEGVDIDATKSIQEMARISDDDLPPFTLDFEDIWDKLSSEIYRDSTDELSEVTAEIVTSNKELAISQMNSIVSEDVILEGINDDDSLQILPLVDLKEILGSYNQSRRGDDTTFGNQEGPAFKRFKGESKSLDRTSVSITQSANPSSKCIDPETQFVFVSEVSTNQKRVITLRKGEQLPPGFEIASIQGDLPPLPDELASFPPTALKEAILGVANPNAASSPPSQRKVNIKQGGTQTQGSSQVKNESTPNRLISLQDLMTAEMQKKSEVDKPRLVYKQRSFNASKLASLITKSSEAKDPFRAKFGGDKVEFLSKPSFGSKKDTNLSGNAADDVDSPTINRSNTPTRKLTISRSTTGSISPVTKPTSSAPGSKSVTQTPARSADTKDKKIALLFGCKLCGETFPCHCDNLFRRHMLIKHDFEIKDDKYFEDNKVNTMCLRRCKKCHLIVLNNLEEHQMKCLPTVPVLSAFEEVNMPSKSTAKLVCGICLDSFEMRYDLKNHVEAVHPDVGAKMILDPDFRCAQCLKRFDEALALSKHCANCSDKRPRTETILELAKSLLSCDLCCKKHSSIEETLACYLEKNIRRCIMCLAIFKDKSMFYKHMLTYHGLTLEPKMMLTCPICVVSVPDKIGAISHHMVSEHFAPMLLTSNQTLPMPPPIQKLIPILTLPQISKAATTPSPNLTPILSGLKKLPDLQPIASKLHGAGLPPGIIINTNRLTPSQFFVGSSTITAVTRPAAVTASQMITKPRVSSAPIRPLTTSPLIAMHSGGRMVLLPVHPQQGGPAKSVVLRPRSAPTAGVGTNPMIRIPIANPMMRPTFGTKQLIRPGAINNMPVFVRSSLETSTSVTASRLPSVATTTPIITTTSSSKPSTSSVTSTSEGIQNTSKPSTRIVTIGDRTYSYELLEEPDEQTPTCASTSGAAARPYVLKQLGATSQGLMLRNPPGASAPARVPLVAPTTPVTNSNTSDTKTIDASLKTANVINTTITNDK